MAASWPSVSLMFLKRSTLTWISVGCLRAPGVVEHVGDVGDEAGACQEIGEFVAVEATRQDAMGARPWCRKRRTGGRAGPASARRVTVARTTRSVGDVASTSEASSTTHGRLSDSGASRIAPRSAPAQRRPSDQASAVRAGARSRRTRSTNETLNTLRTWVHRRRPRRCAPARARSWRRSCRSAAIAATSPGCGRVLECSSSEKVSSMNAIGTKAAARSPARARPVVEAGLAIEIQAASRRAATVDASSSSRRPSRPRRGGSRAA